jgi:dTDP-4-dehydrorhamnose reductase
MLDGTLPLGERILLTGASGQIGGELLKLLAPLGEVVAPSREQMDLADADSVRAAIRAVRPRWIVNPGAYTAVDKAESEPALAYAINAEAVGAIGEEARAIGSGVVHFSTDYVFDGLGDAPYRETDATGPVSVYGASKLAGEKALAESGAGHMIFRTSWVYGGVGRNFLLTILKLAREREVLRVVEDQHGSPTWSRDLAKLTVRAIGRCETAAAQMRELVDVLADVGGLYHAAGAGETTWYGFAAEAVRMQRQAAQGARLAEIEAITTAEYPTRAKRPFNSRMNCSKLADGLGWRMMDWRESLRKVLSEL